MHVSPVNPATDGRLRFLDSNPWFLPLAVFALSLGLNLIRLDATALWNDEAYSILAAENGARAVLRVIADDNQPPLYYLALSQWLGGNGGNIFWVRMLSAFSVAVAAGFVGASARQMFGWRIALIAGVLFAISPLEVNWAQKARPYALQVMFCSMAFWGLVRVIRYSLASEPWPDSNAQHKTERARENFAIGLGWFAYAVGAAGVMLTQHTGGFFLLAANIGAILAVSTSGRLHRRWILSWLGAQACAVLIWSLWLPGFFNQMTRLFGVRLTRDGSPMFYITGQDFISTIWHTYTIFDVWRLLVLAVPVYALIFFFGALRWRHYKPWSYLILATSFIPLLCSLTGFVLIHPIFGYVLGTFVWLQIPLAMLVAIAVAELPAMWPRAVVLACVLALNLLGLGNYYHVEHVRLDLIANLMARDLRPGDAVVVTNRAAASCGLRYYLVRSGIRPPRGIQNACTGDQDRIRSPDDARQYLRLWAISVPDESLPFDPSAPPLGYALVYDSVVGDIHLKRYDLRDKN